MLIQNSKYLPVVILQGEAGGLNYTLAESLKRELDEVNQKINDVKTRLASSEAKFNEINRELTDVKIKLGK